MEDENNKVQITVVIAGRPYSLKVFAEDEPVILRLVNEIKEKVKQFQIAYKSKDKQDLLAMTLLTYAVDLHKVRSKTVADPSTNHLSYSLQEINNLLDNLLTE